MFLWKISSSLAQLTFLSLKLGAPRCPFGFKSNFWDYSQNSGIKCQNSLFSRVSIPLVINWNLINFHLISKFELSFLIMPL